MPSSRAAKTPKTRDAELTIRELAPGGDGVATLDEGGERRAVFVPGTVPGDRVRAAVDLTKRPARGRLLAVLEPSASRVAELPCAFADRCGGCDWMHVAPDARKEAHLAQLRAALPEPWRETAIAYHEAPASLAYRTRARLHVRSSGGRAIVGIHERASHEPIEVEACVVLHPDVERARSSITALFEGTHGRGDVQIALGIERRPVLDVTWSGSLPTAFWGRLEQGVKAGTWAGARATAGETTRPAIVGDPTPWMTGADGAPLRLAAGGFAQASEAGNTALAARVDALAGVALAGTSNANVVELHAGAGNFTVLLARRTAKLVAVEMSRDACRAAEENLRARSLKAKVVEGDAGAYEWAPGTSLVVLDPPRTGARAVAERLATKPVKHVLYVSCDAATLGRDLAVLAASGAWAPPLAVDAFEMFPQTSHLESVVLLPRAPR